MSHFIIPIVLIQFIVCVPVRCNLQLDLDESNQVEYQKKVDDWLDKVDNELMQFNAITAKLSWDVTVGQTTSKTKDQVNAVITARNVWKNRICESEIKWNWLMDGQKRKFYLLCRGPKFTAETAKQEMKVLTEMQRCYQLEVCFDENVMVPLVALSHPLQNTSDYPKAGDCILGEPDFEWLMKRTDLNADQLKWVWETFHNSIGADMRKVYPKVIKMQNFVARANGYSDMGQAWRDELEMPDLKNDVLDLYAQIEPLYRTLHAAVRHKLLQKFGALEVDATSPIPVHLLGNMWGQNWSPLIDLFIPANMSIDLDKKLKGKNWDVHDMVIQAEDYYTSMGLPPMTDTFWQKSIFEKNDNTSMCHGTAANLYRNDDYRIIICAKVNMEDFYVLHHEMGHIEYNMAYKYQPAIFQDGTNSALHETIGDAIMHGVMAPQHLYRLGLLDDNELQDENLDMFLLLQQGLAKIAEIPFALLVDKYRWDIFSGEIVEAEYNKVYWDMNKLLRGVVPPERRSEMYFDAGAKFHVPDNTPYIRYFLSSVLQMQVFKGLCELSLYGKHPDRNYFDDMLPIPLHRCDIYGCKKCGKILQKTMSLGASIHWKDALKMLTGKNYITTKPLLEYYQPIYNWLKKYIEIYDIPVGW